MAEMSFVPYKPEPADTDPADAARRFYEILNQRRSVRFFSDRAVPREVNETLEMGLYEPSDPPLFQQEMIGEAVILKKMESEEALRQAILDREFNVGVALGPDFSRKMRSGEKGTIKLFFSSDFPEEIKETYIIIMKEFSSALGGMALNIDTTPEILGVDRAGAQIPPRDRMRPLMALIMLMLETMGLAMLITEERVRHTLGALIVTPMRIGDFFIGKGISGVGLAFIQATAIVAVTGGLRVNPLLILFVLIAYANIVSQGERSVTQIQTELKSFYGLVMILLEVMVALVAPVIVAMSIQAERQRKSMDLIMTAPVSPKYFLVGKILSGYRYVLMLLFLSLPITAAAVVLGGATWSEVLISYCLIASHGLIYIAISLPIAALSQKVVPTVMYSYVACGAWAYVLSAPAIGMVMYSGMGGFARGAAEAPFWVLMFPMGIAFGVETYTVIWGLHVPNWLLAVATTLLLTKFFVLGAGSALTRIGSKETVSLRVHGLLVALVFSFVLSADLFGLGIGSLLVFSHEFAIFAAVLSVPLVFVLPHLSTWSYVDERKCRPGAMASVRACLSGAPEGGLPYLLMLLGAIYGGLWLSAARAGLSLDAVVVKYLFWLTGAWVFFWSMGWLLSSFTRTGIGTARKSYLAFTVLFTLLPWPALAILQLGLEGIDVFSIYPLVALKYDASEIGTVVFMGIEFWAVAAVMAYWGERRRKKIVSSYGGQTHERQPA